MEDEGVEDDAQGGHLPARQAPQAAFRAPPASTRPSPRARSSRTPILPRARRASSTHHRGLPPGSVALLLADPDAGPGSSLCSDPKDALASQDEAKMACRVKVGGFDKAPTTAILLLNGYLTAWRHGRDRAPQYIKDTAVLWRGPWSVGRWGEPRLNASEPCPTVSKPESGSQRGA